MWWDGRESLDLYLGLGLSGLSGPQTTPASPLVSALVPHADPANGFAARLKELRGRSRLRIWLSSALARPFFLTPVAGLRGREELATLAASVAADATGLVEPVIVWLASIPRARPVLAVAVPAALHRSLVEVSRAGGAAVASLRPWWAGALDLRLRQHGASRDLGGNEVFISSDTDGVVMLTGREQTWQSGTALVPEPNPNQFRAAVTRRMFALGIETAHLVHAHLVQAGPVEAPTQGACWPEARIESLEFPWS